LVVGGRWYVGGGRWDVVGGRWKMSMGKIEQFTDLEVWKNAHAFVLEVYRVTEGYLKKEKNET